MFYNFQVKDHLIDGPKLEKLKLMPSSHWNALIERSMISAPHAFIQILPELKKMEEPMETEEERMEEQDNTGDLRDLKQEEQEPMDAESNYKVCYGEI